MNYIQLTVQATTNDQEIVIGLLEDRGTTGFEQQENRLIAYFDEQDFNQTEIEELLKEYPFHIEVIKEQNWNQVWESNFRPVVVDDFCAIRADFHEPINSTEYEIIITPKMSFGTGHHATTYMMVQQMRYLNFDDKQVFDFGTGTGILAILAEKLGAVSITATDIDEWSINNAAENIERNNCHHIHLYQSSGVPAAEKFDIILANINKNVILESLPSLHQVLTVNGQLLLSGLLAEDEQDITKACESLHLTFQNKMQRQNWISLLFSK